MQTSHPNSPDNPLPSSIAVLLVDDCESDRVTYSRYLQSDSEKTYRIIEATTLEEGLEMWRSQQPDIVLIDLNLPDGDGLEFLEAINVDRAEDRVPVIMLTGQGNEKMAVSAMKSGAFDYLVKGDVTAKLLATTVRQVLRETALGQQLKRSQQQQALSSEIALRIRELLSLEDISNAIVKEVRQFIGADRAAIYKFNPDMSGKIVAEDIVSPWQPCLNVQVQDTCFRENLGGAYCEGRLFVANDIYAANLTACHIKLLERFQVRANLVVPILLPNANKHILWGLLILHQCSAPRIWEESDINLLQRLSVKLAISIQQAIAYQQIQNELAERKRVEALLLDQQEELEERNNLLERTSADLQCTVEELRVTTEEQIAQHQRLEYEQERYQNLFAFAPDGYLVTDLSGRISEVNQVILELLAIRREFIVGKPLVVFVASENIDFFYSQLNGQLPSTKAKTTWETTLRNYQGDLFPAEISVIQNINLGNNQPQLLWMIRNISDRKRAEQELLELNQSLEAKVIERTQAIQLQSQMLEQIHDAVISTALDGTLLTWNTGAEGLYEYKSDEAIGQNVSMLYLNEDLSLMESTVFRPLLEKGSHEVELRNRTKSGEIIDIRLRLSIVRDAVGNPIRLIGCSNNISDRKQAENNLRDSQALLQTVLDAFPLSVFWKDRESIYLGCNQLFAQTTSQQSVRDIVGKNDLNFFNNETQALTYRDDDRQVMESGIAKINFEEIVTTPTGEQIWVQTNKIPLRNVEGHVIGVMGTFQDISDRKQAELQLQKTTERLALALKSGAIGYWELNLADYTIVWDERAYKLHGIPLGTDVTSDIWASSVHPDDLESTQALVNLAIAGEAEFDTEYRVIHPDRSIHFIKGHGVIERDIDGNPIRMTGVNFDISNSKLTEKALKQQLATIEAAIDGIAILQDSKYIYLNQSHIEIFGYKRPDELLGKPWTELYSSKELTRFEQEVFPALIRDRSWQGEAIATRKDGSTFDEGLSLTITEDGLLICVCRDISDRKQAELRLQKTTDRLDLALKSGAIGCWEWDIQDNIAFWDDRMYELYGVCTEKKPQISYEMWIAALHPDDRGASEITTQQIASGQIEEYNTEFRVVHPDGSIRFIKAYGTLKRNADGNPQSIIGINFDISDRKQAEIQLQAVNQELLRATKLKDEFLANMSHELRTPLNSILGLSESLQEQILGSMNARQLKAIRTVGSSGEHLLSLINDILDLSKISSGMMELNIESVSVQNICESSLAFVKQQAFQKRIQINRNIPPRIYNINIDERRIKQVLINLLTNSVKFTPNGGNISLLVAIGSGDKWKGEATVCPQIKAMNSPMIVFQVVDTGIGIAPKDLRLLFQPFVQVDSTLNRQYEGTGLGLALVKQIVELHGGYVMVESEVGIGSRFTVILPYDHDISQFSTSSSAPNSAASPLVVNPESEIAPLILLAEDNEANIQTFSSYLTAVNYRVILARNGEEAVAMTKDFSPDIILMDIQMPKMDGLEAIGLIRADETIAKIPIIALTALAMESDRERCLNAGANAYLAKPIKLRTLNATIQQFL